MCGMKLCGHVECLNIRTRKGVAVTALLCTQNANIECLKYALENGCPVVVPRDGSLSTGKGLCVLSFLSLLCLLSIV